ncbi:MAG TPA: hypothetical protein VFE71_06350 [Bacteroidales bacterium]|nr:hypothetical protein [Bacteroidales bacterium]
MSKAKKTFTDDKILSKMNREAQTPGCIAARLGCAAITISRALPRLYEDGLIEKVIIKGSGKKTFGGWYTELKSRRKR